MPFFDNDRFEPTLTDRYIKTQDKYYVLQKNNKPYAVVSTSKAAAFLKAVDGSTSTLTPFISNEEILKMVSDEKPKTVKQYQPYEYDPRTKRYFKQ